MDCKKTQKLLPDLRSGHLSSRLKTIVSRHLADCETCQRWLETWDQVCNLSLEVCLPQEDLDWKPFDLALEAELQRSPLPGRQRRNLAEIYRDVSVYIRTTASLLQRRVVLAGAAAVFVILVSNHLISPPTVERSNLILGKYLTSDQHGDVVLYQQGETDYIYFREEISLELIEGKEYIP